MTTKSGVFGTFGISSLCASIAVACPICHTDLGRQVRSGIFGADFWTNLLLVLLPFPVFLLLAAALHYGFRRDAPNMEPAESTEQKLAGNKLPHRARRAGGYVGGTLQE